MSMVKEFPSEVNEYIALDNQIKELTKRRDELNKRLKEDMRLMEMDKVETNDYVLSYIIQNRVTINEPKLIDRLKLLGFSRAIVLVEKVDSDVVESLIYNGELAPADVEDCNEYKEVETLKVTKKKGAKNNG